MTAAHLYLRQSKDVLGDGAAVDRQRAECEELCAVRGWTVGTVYDQDKSASTGRRPQFEQLLRDIAAGSVGAIVSWHPDRIARRPDDLERLIAVVERTKVKVATVQAGEYDLNTPSGRATARTVVAWARAEVELKAERQKAGNRQRAVAGRPPYGPVPLGYSRTLVRNDFGRVLHSTLEPIPGEAEAVRRAYDALLAGGSLRSIAADWNAAGFRTTAGEVWEGDTVRKRLVRPEYAGLTVFDGQIVGTGNWKPLVAEETWRAAVALLTDPSRRTATGYTRRYLLPGLARCGVEGCGLKVVTGRSHRLVRTYKCTENHMARAAEPVDEIVTAFVLERLSRDDARELLHDDSRPDFEASRTEAQALRARRDELALMLGRGTLTPRAFELADAEARQELETVEARLERGGRGEKLRGVVGPGVHEVWPRLHVDRQTAIIGELMSIVLMPLGRGTKKVDPRSVVIDWR